MTMFRKKIFSYIAVITHNILYLTKYLIFPCILKLYSVSLKIGQYTKNDLMLYNLSIFGKIFFVVTVNYDVIGI